MIVAMARHRVQVLHAAGLPQARIAAIEGISERSVRTICGEAPIEDPRDLGRARERGVGRPSVAEPFRDRVVAVLAAEPTLPTTEVLHRLRGQGYAGGKSALYELVRELRPKSTVPLVRFEGVAGEFSQHDFGRVEVRYLGSTRERLHFFVSRLKFSRWVDVRVVEDEGVESLVRSLLAGFESFGGVPLVGEQYAADKRTVLKMEFRTFQQAFVAMPCQIVRAGRKIVYRLLAWNPWQRVFLRGVEALRLPLRC
jgi:transposase